MARKTFFEHYAMPKYSKSIPKRFQVKEWSLEDIRKVLKLGEGYIRLKKRGWKGLVGHPSDQGKCGTFFYFPYLIF
jgi:hypothetical protein